MRAGMMSVLCVNLLILPICSAAATEPSTGLLLKDLDRQVSALTRKMEGAGDIRDRVAGSLRLELDHRLLYDLSGGEYGVTHLQAIQEAIRAAVSGSGRYPSPGVTASGSEALVLQTGIVLVESEYPPVSVSETEWRASLIVRFWVCPDRRSALALLWLRRGGSLPDAEETPSSAKDALTSSRVRLSGDTTGEVAYLFSRASQYNAPLERDDPRAGGDRMVFIRENLIVEVSTWTFVHRSKDEPWVTPGMMEGGARESVAVLKALDSFIQDNAGSSASGGCW